MYLLDTQQVMDLVSRDSARAVFEWLGTAKPDRSALFVSVVSFGQIAHAIEDMKPVARNHWRRLLQEGRREFEEAGSVVIVDMPIVEVWSSNLRGDHLSDIQGADESLGEDDRLIIATAISRNWTLVTEGSSLMAQIAERTSLALQEL